MTRKRGIGPTILDNGSRAQDLENYDLNGYTWWVNFSRLLETAMSVFEWDGLPTGIDSRTLEYWLLVNGFCVFFKDDELKNDPKARAPEGYAVLPAMLSGEWDNYMLPMNRELYSFNGFQKRVDETDSVIIFNNYLRVPMIKTIEWYAHKITRVDRAIDVNVEAQKTPKIVRCDEKQKLTLKNVAKQYDGYAYWIWADKTLDLNDVEILDLSVEDKYNDLWLLRNSLWNSALTYLGVENTTTEKKERLITAEIYTAMGDVEAQRYTRLKARQRAAEEINELFGLDVKPSFSSGSYIKAMGYGSNPINVDQMGATIESSATPQLEQKEE